MSPSTLDQYREKWREAPRGSDTDGRIFSTDLLALADGPFLEAWDAMAARRYAGEIGWLGPLYADTFAGRRVLELGSGLGFDGLRFAGRGAFWTFADIVPDNLAVIRRVASLRGLEERVGFHLIGDDLSFSGLSHDYDAIWVFGSIHHVPFEIARREALNALEHLKPGGRWMELVYPRERWLREGAPPFERWGKLTDGERTPWAEWHDLEKVRQRLSPVPFSTILDFEFCSHNYRWLDLQHGSDQPFRLADAGDAAVAVSADLLHLPVTREAGHRQWWRAGLALAGRSELFVRIASIDLGPALAQLGTAAGWAVELEVEVSAGSVGIGLVDRTDAYLPAAEQIADAGPDCRRIVLRAVANGRPARLVFRNLRAGTAPRFRVRSASLRTAT
ncbi:MAG TPA: class I SAM-dependent methyltransferase [Reyranella sp.]|nr:class I SAM-dependent methyltransferase [Reyranella sp.]